MKRADLYFALVVAAFFVPFFLSRTLLKGISRLMLRMVW